jgi:branched-chain amino acid transport system substrate-binding protein
LGTSVWNSPDFVKRISTSIPNIYFVDAYYPDSTSQNVQNFIALYKSVYDREPTGMDAMAYDTAVLVDSLMRKLSSSAKRSDFRDALSNVKNFPGISGTLSFADHQNTRGLKVFTLNSSKILEVQ